MGNLTRDPQLSYLPTQTPVVEFSLATNRQWTDKQGNKREDVCFVDCKCFGKLATTISTYCKKGRPLHIEGRLCFDRWESKNGEKRSKHYITLDSFTFVDSAPKNLQGTQPVTVNQPQAVNNVPVPTTQPIAPPQPQTEQSSYNNIGDMDIPY
jgi:single-strand DNA-binding protein